MLKVIVGYVSIDSEDLLKEVSVIVNNSNCVIEEEDEYKIEISHIDPEAMFRLFNQGYITESDYNEIESVDHILFHL